VDTDRGKPVAVVNETAARRWWPGQSAVGKRIRFGAQAPWMDVIGVAGDIKSTATFGDVQVYDLLQPENMQPDPTVVAMTSGEPESLIGTLKGQVWSVDPRVPVTEIATLTQAMSETMARPRFNMVL
jgi:putative ABC transport system permease protein